MALVFQHLDKKSAGAETVPSPILNTPVPLNSPAARVLCQKVHGTLNTYRVFCYSSFLAVAVRRSGDKVSVRAAAQSGHAIPTKLAEHFKSLGMDEKEGYMSGHMSIGDLTLWHVLAPIAFNPAVDWTAVCKNMPLLVSP